MKSTAITDRLHGTGGAKWGLHIRARQLVAEGKDIIELTIGEPDLPTPPELIDVASDAMRRGRTKYSDGRGEAGLREALAEFYSKKCNRTFSKERFLCFPGTQTSLFAVLMGVAEIGDEVLVGDPMYVTYEGVIRACGADMIPVPLRPENGFRMTVDDIAARITEKTTALLITTPHNPTGAILTQQDIRGIGELAAKHDLWIISDEVYEELVFDNIEFHSPLSNPDMEDRTIVVSSISKSHAAPGFRSGWCVGPSDFVEKLLPLSEAMLFGNQPFIADMTEHAIRNGSTVAEGMRTRYSKRARMLQQLLSDETSLKMLMPEAGMFAMIDVASTGMSGEEYAIDLLEKYNVAVIPGSSFGTTVGNWVRIALTVDDESFTEAANRIVRHANTAAEAAA